MLEIGKTEVIRKDFYEWQLERPLAITGNWNLSNLTIFRTTLSEPIFVDFDETHEIHAILDGFSNVLVVGDKVLLI